MRSVVFACEHACAGACPDRRRVAGHPSRTSAVTAGPKGDEERKEVYGNREEEERKREREACRPLGSKAQKNSVACHGVESTPKIHSLAPLSHVCKVAPNLTKRSSRQKRRNVATSESIFESGFDDSQNFASELNLSHTIECVI